MTNSDQIMATVTEVARTELGLPADVVLTETSRLADVVWFDSVRLMAFVESVESAFGVEFAIDELSGEVVTNMGLLAALVRRSLAA